MITPNSTVYYTSGPFVQEAKFLSYSGDCCVLQTPMGELKIRKGRVFTAAEATERRLLDSGAKARIQEALRYEFVLLSRLWPALQGGQR